jgi:alpha-L-rhamnosidase
MYRPFRFLLAFLLLPLLSATAQNPPTSGSVDPTSNIRHPQLFSSFHKPLPEQYIWTSEDSTAGKTGVIHYVFPKVTQQIEPHYFRARFHLDSVPPQATLYVAGPRSASVWVNGTSAGNEAANLLSPLGMHVFRFNLAPLLHSGDNLLALEVVRGRGVTGFLNSSLAMQQTFGKVMVAKIVPRAPGIDAPAILISGPDWKATLHPSGNWQSPDFDDRSWPAVAALSPIEGSIDLFQWNADAGLYDWPGYEGASPFLAHAWLPAAALHDVYAGNGEYQNLDALTSAPGQNQSREFTLQLPAETPSEEFVPGLTLDFGREVTGRVELVSDSDVPVTVTIQYGESMGEVNDGPYLGVNVLHIAPHSSGHGPKSAFRYARIRFLSGGPLLRFHAIHLEDIYYPVHYQASFESSDPLLNRIWQVGAYTTHLCMQDDIWDAPKRDRGRWMGDTDVSGRVSDTVFADNFLLEDTLTRLVGAPPVEQHVNGIPGYSSFWFTELADHYRHSGGREYVASMHDRIVQLLQLMDREFDAQNQFLNRTHAWLFVDWALDLNGDTPQSREGTIIEYVRAYHAGVWLLRQLGDTKSADHFEARAQAIAASARQHDWTGDSFGPRIQTNAMAVLAGVAQPGQYGDIWKSVLSRVGQPTFRPDLVTPYYGAYILDAMAKMNHREDALKWIREYWGGMLAEDATSFWEAYDPSWPKDNPHLDLQADGRSGYFVSMAHGWSSGPTYWLTEQVLGIQPTAPGFEKVTIRPDLADLSWARGSEPTPHGLLQVDLKKQNGMDAVIQLPAGVEATVLMPATAGKQIVTVNGQAQSGTSAENGARVSVVLNKPGRYELRSE